MVFSKAAGKELFHVKQDSLNNFPLERVTPEQIKTLKEFVSRRASPAFPPPRKGALGVSSAGFSYYCVHCALVLETWLELCAALGGWWRQLGGLGPSSSFDRVQGFAKPRVFGSLDFTHKCSSLVLQLLRKNSHRWWRQNYWFKLSSLYSQFSYNNEKNYYVKVTNGCLLTEKFIDNYLCTTENSNVITINTNLFCYSHWVLFLFCIMMALAILFS